jgi:hypothetical protein
LQQGRANTTYSTRIEKLSNKIFKKKKIPPKPFQVFLKILYGTNPLIKHP